MDDAASTNALRFSTQEAFAKCRQSIAGDARGRDNRARMGEASADRVVGFNASFHPHGTKGK